MSTIRLGLWHGSWPSLWKISLGDGFFRRKERRRINGGNGEQNGGVVCVCSEGTGVIERINGSYYLVLTVGPGHLVMDVRWQVMVLCRFCLSKQRWWTQMFSLVNNQLWLHLVQEPAMEHVHLIHQKWEFSINYLSDPETDWNSNVFFLQFN